MQFYWTKIKSGIIIIIDIQNLCVYIENNATCSMIYDIFRFPAFSYPKLETIFNQSWKEGYLD